MTSDPGTTTIGDLPERETPRANGVSDASEPTITEVVVLTAGEMGRIRPLTRHRPQPVVPCGNRPVIEYVAILTGASIGSSATVAHGATAADDVGEGVGVIA